MRHAARFAFIGVLLAGSVRGADTIDYAKQILPIFKDNCEKCHGPEKDKGDLRLHDPKLITEAEVIIPGKPDESELFAGSAYRISTTTRCRRAAIR